MKSYRIFYIISKLYSIIKYQNFKEIDEIIKGCEAIGIKTKNRKRKLYEIC
jgi:hypothetical protein